MTNYNRLIQLIAGTAIVGALLWPTENNLSEGDPEPVVELYGSSQPLVASEQWGAMYQRTREQGIADLRELARTESLEDLFLFFPDKNIWVDTGYNPHDVEGEECKTCISTSRSIREKAIREVYGEIPQGRVVEAIHYHPTLTPSPDHPELHAGPLPIQDGRSIEARMNLTQGTLDYYNIVTGQKMSEEEVAELEIFETEFDNFFRMVVMAPSPEDLMISWENRDIFESCTIVSEFGDLTWDFPLNSSSPDYGYIHNQLSYLGLFTNQDEIKGLALEELAPFFEIDYLEE
jgi:hypothetical protein